MSDVEIRATVPSDLDALADVLVQVYAADGYPVEGVDDPRAWVNLPGALGQWTALLDERPVGHAALVPSSIEDRAPEMLARQGDANMAKIAVLSRLFVDPTSRGKGVARQLLDVVEAEANQRGLFLVLDVMAKDRSAIHLYERRGWELLGCIEHEHALGQVTPGFAALHR